LQGGRILSENSKDLVIDASGYLERFYDSGLRLPRNATKQSLTERQVARISRAAALVFVAGSLKRRIDDATAEDLALDKRRVRRVDHALRQSIIGWTRKIPRIVTDAEIQREGAQLEWEPFLEAHLTQINTELRLLATWAIRNDEARWGRTAVVNLENEIRWMSYAMR